MASPLLQFHIDADTPALTADRLHPATMRRLSYLPSTTRAATRQRRRGSIVSVHEKNGAMQSDPY
jgi:hypothetical protein